jgi:hypothetical protein
MILGGIKLVAGFITTGNYTLSLLWLDTIPIRDYDVDRLCRSD